jgi:hypothetical protein
MKKTTSFPFRLIASLETSTNLPITLACLLLGIGRFRRCHGLGMVTIYYYLWLGNELPVSCVSLRFA